MGNIVRVGLVGAPFSGKTFLTGYLRNYLANDYVVVVAEDVTTRLLKLGLSPGNNITELDFQLECLKAYSNLYKDIDTYIKKYMKNTDKDIVIIYDTLPAMSQCFLESSEDLLKWVEQSTKENFSEYKIDLLFVAELLRGDYSIAIDEIERDLDIDEILTIADRIDYVFQDGIKLSNDLTIEERISIIVGEISDYLKPNITN